MDMPKFVTAQQAVEQLRDGCTLGISSFGGWLGTDELYCALRERFLATGSPRNLHICGGVLPGGLNTQDVGLNILALDGLVSRVTAAHVGMAPLFSRLITDNKAAGFAVPLGIFTKLLRCSAAHEPGLITKVGLGGFCDSAVDACRLNDSAKNFESPVRELLLDGERYLFYTAPKIDACFIRVSCADENGCLSAADEPVTGDQLAMAAAVHNNGGLVIAQAAHVVPAGAIPPRSVLIPPQMVDYIVIASPEHSAPGYDCPAYRPELVGGTAADEAVAQIPPIRLDQRSICARRAAQELRAESLINIGIGMPDGVADAAAQEGIAELITLSLESGPLGGVPVTGVGFGAAQAPVAILPMADNFDFYDGGGLDMAFLGAAEIDRQGNVNVSAFSNRVTGPGGFIDIAQNTPFVCFLSSFTAGGLRVGAQDGRLKIESEGRAHKFVEKVQQITFSAKTALEQGQRVLYITERAVFTLTERGLCLIELAPGVELERDILAQMDFKPDIAKELKTFDAAILREAPMGLREKLAGK